MPCKRLKDTKSMDQNLLIEKLLVSQIVKLFPYFMKPDVSLPRHNADHIFSKMNAVNASHSLSLRSTCNIILSCTPVSSKRALSFGVPCQIFVYISVIGGRDSSVGIATGYGLDGLGIESRWGRDFSHTSTPASCTMGTGSFPGVKRPERGADHPPPSSAEVKKE
jgi:hypothetical protein